MRKIKSFDDFIVPDQSEIDSLRSQFAEDERQFLEANSNWGDERVKLLEEINSLRERLKWHTGNPNQLGKYLRAYPDGLINVFDADDEEDLKYLGKHFTWYGPIPKPNEVE